MAHINLLPWREKQRQAKKKEYLGILGLVAFGAFAVMYLVGMTIDHMIDNQRHRNQFMQTQIAGLDAQIAKIKDIKEKKAAIEQQMALIEQLQTSRNVAAHVLDELAKIVPAGVSFKSLKRTNNQIEVQGQSESNNRLAEFMRQLQNSEVFDREDLSSIRASQDAGGAVSDFKITFHVSNKIAPDLTLAENKADDKKGKKGGKK